jgi:hypothetical protein
MKDIYYYMNSQDILKNLGIGFDLELDNSETYDYEISGFDNDYDPKVLDFSTPLVLPVGVLNDLRNDRTNRPFIKLCEIDNRPNDPNYIYSGLEQIFDYDEFTNHFNIKDEEGNIIHDYENFILNNDVFTYTGYTNEIHYFKICEYPLAPSLNAPIPTLEPTSTPEPTSTLEPTLIPTSDPTPTPEPTPTIESPSPTSTPQECIIPHTVNTTVITTCGVNFSTSLSLACQSKDNLNSGGCSGGVASWSLYRDTDGDPSIGDVFYRYSDKCTPFTFLNGYGIIEGSTEFILLNFTNGVVTEIVDCSSLPTPTETSTPTPTETPTVTPTIGCTLPHPETSTVFESCGGENFADSLSWACQMKDTFNSGGGCTGGTSYRTLYRDGSGVPSIGDPFYRYQNTCEVFTFLNGYSVLSTTDGYVVVNTLNGIVIGIENCSSLPTPTETSTPAPTDTPTPTESSTPIPTSTETPLPTATTLISSITLAYNYSLGMGSLSFSGMTTNELGDATCNSLAANYQTQTYYGDTLGLGTQFTNGNNIHSDQFWVTNQYYGTLQGPLWVVGSTEYIIETDVNGVVVRYEPFIVQCTPTPTPNPTSTPEPTSTPTDTPLPTTGLLMDFDASTSNSFTQDPYPSISDGDTIVNWDNTVSGQPDFGGAGTIFNPPTWDSSSSDFNNLGAVNFVPNQSLIAQGITGLSVTNAYTMFIVVTTTSTSPQWILQGLKSNNSADESLMILFTNGNFQVTTTTNYNRIIPYTTNTPTLYTVVYDGTQSGADMMVIRENGVFKNSGTISLPSNLNSTLTGIELGTNAGESVGLYGQIPTFKMYNTVLTNSEITTVENSLMNKFNL